MSKYSDLLGDYDKFLKLGMLKDNDDKYLLSDEERKYFIYRYIDGLSAVQITEICGVSKTTVYKNSKNALCKLSGFATSVHWIKKEMYDSYFHDMPYNLRKEITDVMEEYGVRSTRSLITDMFLLSYDSAFALFYKINSGEYTQFPTYYSNALRPKHLPTEKVYNEIRDNLIANLNHEKELKESEDGCKIMKHTNLSLLPVYSAETVDVIMNTDVVSYNAILVKNEYCDFIISDVQNK